MPMNDRQKYAILHKAKKKSIGGDNGCILWTGNRNATGYGLIEYTDETTKKRHCLPIHRALYIINNNIELGRLDYVCHKCDTPLCINMKHLFVGTPKDNAQDMRGKGRGAKRYRYHHRERKFSNELIEIAKEQLRAGSGSHAVARALGMSQSYVWAINHGKVKRVEGEVYPLHIAMSLKSFRIAMAQGRTKGWQ